MAFVNLVRDIVNNVEGFTACLHKVKDNSSCLIVSYMKLFDHHPLGPTSRVKITIDSSREFTVHVLFEEVEKGVLENPFDVLSLCEHYSTESTSYKFCPGHDPTEYKGKYYDVIKYDVKGIRSRSTPIHRSCRVCEMSQVA